MVKLMKQQGAAFYLALITWLSVLVLTLSNWLSSDSLLHASIKQPSLIEILLVVLLFILFFIGYLLIGDVFNHSIKKHKRYAGLWLAIVATIALTVFFQFGLIGILAIIIIAQLPAFQSAKFSYSMAIIVSLSGASIDFFVHHLPDALANGVLYALFNLFAVLASFRFIAERKAKNKSEQLVRELKATQMLLSASTKRDERLRISRDVHDVLGHHLTALNLQLEVASHVKDDSAQVHVRQAKEICGLLLTDVRQAVSEFRKEQDIDLRAAVTLLTQNIPKLKVNLSFVLEQKKINARIAEIIFRCVQEGITNVIKHANATICDIALITNEQWLELTIKDNGHEFQEVLFGNGLNGMKERVEQVDGLMTFNNLQTGVLLQVKLPNYMI